MNRTIPGFVLASLIAGAMACQQGAPSSGTTPEGGLPATGTPVSTDIVLKQPDFRADMTGVFGDTRFTGRVARRGETFRIETSEPPLGNSVLLIRPDQPVLVILPERKQYLELPAEPQAGLVAAILSALRTPPDAKVDQFGTDRVEGHEVARCRVKRTGGMGDVFVFPAADMQNLILRILGVSDHAKYEVVMKNAVLGAPDDLFKPPADLASYKKVQPEELASGSAPPAGEKNPETKAPEKK